MKRYLYYELIDHIPKKEFSILMGARQTGKSTILRQIEAYCKRDDIPHLYLNLENKTILTELDQHPLNVFRFLPEVKNRMVVLIDEVQYLNDATNFLKLLYDEHADRIKIIATGSSAFYMDKRFKDSLAGRKKLFFLSTCNFGEYLEMGGKDDLLEEKQRLENRSGLKSVLITRLKLEWECYMLYGGYPSIITEPNKQEKIERLNEIRDSFIKRDIEESGVINELAFYSLMRILAAQTGSLVNTNELASTLRIKHETVSNYLYVLQKCFHVALVKPFFSNLRKELTKMPKVYFMDTGLRNSLINNFSQPFERQDKGELWENTVFRLLIDKYGLDELRYWRTSAGNEVDFVLPHLENKFAVEAKYDLNSIKTSKYKVFERAYPEIRILFWNVQPFTENVLSRINE